MKVYRNREKLSGKFIINYIMTGATNIARDYLRKKRRRMLTDEIETVDKRTPELSYLVTERLEFYKTEIEPRIEALPKRQREAVLAYARSNNIAREARNLGVKYETLRSRRDAGFKRLRKLLS